MLPWAQNHEDVMLARAFDGQATGFYVDVGAGHPSEDPVTRHFYDLGWRGINVEPVAESFALLARQVQLEEELARCRAELERARAGAAAPPRSQ